MTSHISIYIGVFHLLLVQLASRLQTGHQFFSSNHVLIQTLWNTWPHGRAYASFLSTVSRQIVHSVNLSSCASSTLLLPMSRICFSRASAMNVCSVGRRMLICDRQISKSMLDFLRAFSASRSSSRQRCRFCRCVSLRRCSCDSRFSRRSISV